ncbi:hypothetical protein EYZ11_009421 [Aspergillus tanneri]|uniref:Uncharacterized protein n=1 Tax=Aspergillus tanneri TaxID=1220188 RepID=A0A4S3JA24_9EURO|nr:hypothetical protein EYZ11_009421 [Aspergillus tanneri]
MIFDPDKAAQVSREDGQLPSTWASMDANMGLFAPTKKHSSLKRVSVYRFAVSAIYGSDNSAPNASAFISLRAWHQRGVGDTMAQKEDHLSYRLPHNLRN